MKYTERILSTVGLGGSDLQASSSVSDWVVPSRMSGLVEEVEGEIFSLWPGSCSKTPCMSRI